MSASTENKMGYAPIGKLLFSMSLPAIFSMLVGACYNIVDSMYVSRLGEEALASVSLAFPVQMLILAVAMGTGIGINSLVSRRLGAKSVDEANTVATHGLVLAIASGVVFALLGVFGAHAFFSSFTESAKIISMGTQYTTTVTLLSVCVFVEINIERTMQGTGNMVYPMAFQILGSIINVCVDPILIFGLFGVPALGVLGAAISTVISQAVTMSLSLFILFHKDFPVRVSFKNFHLDIKIVKNIYAVGLPAILMQSIVSIVIMFLNTILIGFSAAAVAVLGVYYKLQSFISMALFGLLQGSMPILGYNYGAKDKKRFFKCYRLALLYALCIMTAGTLLFWIFPKQLLLMFNATPEMLETGVHALRILSLSFIPSAFVIPTCNMFQAVGQGFKSLVVVLMRQLVGILPLSWLFAKFIGISMVWWSFGIAEMLSLVTVLIMLSIVYKKIMHHMEEA
ncbi:MAG: MATE family efflux transporter [Oscillospiraceae bacterium]